MTKQLPESVTIFLLEDDNIHAASIERAFRKSKIMNPIIRAKDGVEGLEMLRGTHPKHQIKQPYIMLIDINMPRMDGIEFLSEVRKDPVFRSSIAFMLTTSKRDQDKLAAYDLIVAGYMVKENAGKNFLRLIGMVDFFWRIVDFPETMELVEKP